MVAEKKKSQEEPKTEEKLYNCQKCSKKVVLDDFNKFYGLCIKCESGCGNSLMR